MYCTPYIAILNFLGKMFTNSLRFSKACDFFYTLSDFLGEMLGLESFLLREMTTNGEKAADFLTVSLKKDYVLYEYTSTQ